ncbi:MAG: hypothetical protein PHP25_01625 [Candidatus Moranbacteria bacterium]|nr:hypothetical protein [Candidatus Moranbacteria bacterium]
MAQQSYQEPIEKEDLDLAKKLKGDIPAAGVENTSANVENKISEKPEIPQTPEAPAAEKIPGIEAEAGAETKPEEVSEKIETARKTIQTQKPAAGASVSDDAGTVSQITEYEKKVEKLMELALHRGPEHAIKVAQHMDKGKNTGQADNYTLDEIHDRLLEDELRKQLIAKGLLKEL